MNSAWAFNPDWSDAEAEVHWQVRDLTPQTPLSEKFKRLATLVPTLARLSNMEVAAILEGLRVRLKLRGEDLAGLRVDVKKARKEREAKEKKGQGNPQEIGDLQENLRLHPAIDFQADFMSVGFRVDLPDNGSGLLLVVSDGAGVKVEVAPEEIEMEGKAYQVKPGAPPFLRDVWGLDKLKSFMAHPTYAKLYHDLVAVYKTFLDLPEPAYGLLATWAVGTYFAHLFAAFPYLHFHGPKESGKSKTLESLRHLSFNAWKGREITAAALGDTADGQRGTLLLDQAEKLSSDQETGNLLGLLADGYKKVGGQRRVVETGGRNGRTVLEFSTYGPKAFASTKQLDPDLADRCVRIPMTRTRRKLPDLEGWEPVWGELRDKLYRFALAKFKDVRRHYEAMPGDGTRIGELWRPLPAVLLALGVKESEIDGVRDFFLDGAQEGRHEPTGWECTLLEVLKGEAQAHDDKLEMTAFEILTAMNIEGEKKPGNKWVGEALSRYHLHTGRKRQWADGNSAFSIRSNSYE